MCGLVCFTGTKPDLEVLSAAAAQAAERGCHTYGWAWKGNDGTFTRQAGDGRLPPPPAAARDARIIIGHARLATRTARPGNHPPVSETQPLVSGTVLVAHNGTIPDPDDLAGEHVIVDTTAILLALKRGLTLEHVTSYLARSAPHALIVADGDTVKAVRVSGERRAHHLWTRQTPAGTYLSSRRFDQACEQLPDGITNLTWRKP